MKNQKDSQACARSKLKKNSIASNKKNLPNTKKPKLNKIF